MLIIIGRDITGSGARTKRGQELDKKTKYRMYESPPACFRIRLTRPKREQEQELDRKPVRTELALGVGCQVVGGRKSPTYIHRI
jgi:hypothetical protein